ncbi:unnamed protein product, partial [Adineta ricciae]
MATLLLTNFLNSTPEIAESDEEILLKRIKFGLFLSFQIPSIICHLFLIYHLIHDRLLRVALRNHVILVLLILNFLLITIDLSIVLDFLYIGYIREKTVQ